MRGICDTCDQLAELVPLAGRTDMNCCECADAIQRAVELFHLRSEMERAGGELAAIDTQLQCFVNKLFQRSRSFDMASRAIAN